MSNFGDSEAEEDSLDESLSNKSDDEEDDDEEGDEEGDEDRRDDANDIINDEEEESGGEEEEAHHGHHHRKRRKDELEAELDEEDLSLIEENLGIRLQRKKPRLKKVKLIDSDDDEEDQSAGNAAVKEREAIASELFEGAEDTGEVPSEAPVQPQADDTYAAIDDSEESEEDVDDFIVDDDGNPIKHAKKKRRIPGTVKDSALMEAQDIFGLDFDFDEFEKYGRDDFSSDEEEDEYEEEDGDDGALRRQKKKSTKKSIYEVFEPSELEKGMLTSKDNNIRTADVPERFQVRDFAVKSAEEGELDDEAEWIYRRAFLEMPISQQQDPLDGDLHSRSKPTKPPSAVGKIREALNLMRNQLFEVPFIANYRKEYIDPELNTDDLWKVWAWDEKWCQLRSRKENLHRLFQEMQDYQFNKIQESGDKPLDDDTRILQPEDIDRLDRVETMEQLKDVYSHFMLYYRNDIPAMWEAKRKKQSEDGADGEAKESTPHKQKMPAKRDLYTICRQAGVSGLARKFGLTPDQFGENLRDNYQRHETQQHPVEPDDTAEHYLSSTFSTVSQVLEAARHMVAMQIARDPLVRQCVRQTFYERAKLKIKATKKGKKEIDESHSCSTFKYIKHKPVRDLNGDQFLRMCKAEEDGLLTISIGIDLDKGSGYHTYFDEVKQLYYRDEFSHLVQEWNTQRTNALSRAFSQMLYPLFEKELKLKLLDEAKNAVVKSCCRRLRSWIEVAPYQPEQHVEEQDYEDSSNADGFRVLACSISPNPDTPAFLAMLDGGGQVNDYLRLKYILNRRNATRAKEREDKENDLASLKQFILKKRPQVVVVAAECREALSVVDDVKMCIAELEQENQISAISVEALDGEVARLFMSSPRSENEFREYPSLLRHAVSLGRRIQDPLSEFAALCVEEDELLCLRLHPFQDHVSKEHLVRSLHQEFVSVVNDVGVDPNRLLEHPHTVALLQFVCGLGPRKASSLLKSLRQQCTRLENRSQLVTVCGLGPQVFLNCAGFIKIDTAAISDSTTNYIEVLDGSRVHPETYEWAKKMAVDALEYDEATMESNPSSALEEILEAPDRLKDLDLDAFAEELERQGYGNKRITLYDIRDEMLLGQYRERRLPYRALTVEERFRLLTGETGESLYVGKLVVCTVTGFANRKPPRDMIDQAQPVRNDESGQWQCPFCLQDTFPDLSEVWTHLDNGSCAGQAIGVRTRMDNGLSGFIPTKMISDKHISSPHERVKVGMTLHCRVTRINMERLQLDLTCRSSDLADKEGKYSLLKDKYYDDDAADNDKKEDEAAKKKANRPKYVKRVIVHPAFKNISFKEAERLLAEMDQGECIVRPSSKGADHLTVTWKVDEGIYQHVDVREEGKENAFSLGRSLWIDSEEFEDLDEIIARHIQPMASFAREIFNHKNYRAVDGNKSKLEECLHTEKRKAPQRIPYLLSTAKEFPGKFFLGYLPRVKTRVEYVSVTPDGFRYRGRLHASLNGLFKWFKEHFRDPIPGTPRHRMPVAMSESNTPYTPGGTPSINTDVDPARLQQQLQQHFPRGITDPKVYSALAAVARQQQKQEAQKKTTPTQLTPAQWGAAAAQHVQRQNKQRAQAQQTPTQQTPTQQGYQQYPQYGYYQQHQDQTQTPTYGYQQTYSGSKATGKESSKSR